VKERLKLHNVCTDHVIVQSELKYSIVAKIVNLICEVDGGTTGPFPTVQVFLVIRPIATVWFVLEPDPESTLEFRPVVNTNSIR
jgi:hypothetical protein